MAGISGLPFRQDQRTRCWLLCPTARHPCLRRVCQRGHLRLKGSCHPGFPFGAVWLGFVLLSIPNQGWANLGRQPLPPAHTQAVIHRQEVSSWWSLPDLQVGLVPMGTVGSRQMRPQLP